MKSTKEIVKPEIDKFKAVCKDLGIDLKQGQLYEIFSRMNGFKSWNHLSAEKPEAVIKEIYPADERRAVDDTGYSSIENEGKHTFSIKLRVDAELTTIIEVEADSPEEALRLVEKKQDKIIDDGEEFGITWMGDGKICEISQYFDMKVADSGRTKNTYVWADDESGFNCDTKFDIIMDMVEYVEKDLSINEAMAYCHEYRASSNKTFQIKPSPVVPIYMEDKPEEEKEEWKEQVRREHAEHNRSWMDRL